MDKKKTGEYEKEKGTGSEAKKEIKRKLRENVGNCPFENERIYPMTTVKAGTEIRAGFQFVRMP